MLRWKPWAFLGLWMALLFGSMDYQTAQLREEKAIKQADRAIQEAKRETVMLSNWCYYTQHWGPRLKHPHVVSCEPYLEE